jgi:dienelactone hydrolase
MRGGSEGLRVRLPLLLLLLVMLVAVAPPVAAGGNTTTTGTLGGVPYRVDVPESWNGTVLLFSHGYVVPGHPNPATDSTDQTTADYLLARGYALAGSAYASTGWAVEDALRNQMTLLDAVQRRWHPRRVVAWGASMGGLLSALLVQRHPDRFAGGVPFCGVLGGGSEQWNTWLTSQYAFWRLVANGDPHLQLVHITNPAANVQLAVSYLREAQETPAGRAHVALAAALGDVPGWSSGGAPASPAAQEAAQAQFEKELGLWFGFAGRAELEARADGNPSWTAGVDYSAALDRSVAAPEVRGLYRQAGLHLGADLARLTAGPQVPADSGAAAYLARFGTPEGAIRRPLLTVHTIGDGLVPVANEQSFAARVGGANAGGLLRQAFVGRAGHCAFTAGEAVAGMGALLSRLGTGRWPDLSAAALDARAASVGDSLNPSAPAFTPYQAPATLRPGDWPTG